MKIKEKNLARQLRSEGKSVREIAQIVGVSKGSVSLWVRDVELTDDQKIDLDNRTNQGPASKKNAEKCRLVRCEFQEDGKKKAKENDPDHKAMCMLYWAEGSKKRNNCVMTNSDVRMMVYFLSLVRRYFGVSGDRIRVSIKVHIDNGLSLDSIENWWLEKFGLQRSCLTRSSVDRRVASGMKGRKNRLHYGVCSVAIHDTKVVQHIFGAIQEYVGFDETSWLDKR